MSSYDAQVTHAQMQLIAYALIGGARDGAGHVEPPHSEEWTFYVTGRRRLAREHLRELRPAFRTTLRPLVDVALSSDESGVHEARRWAWSTRYVYEARRLLEIVLDAARIEAWPSIDDTAEVVRDHHARLQLEAEITTALAVAREGSTAEVRAARQRLAEIPERAQADARAEVMRGPATLREVA